MNKLSVYIRNIMSFSLFWLLTFCVLAFILVPFTRNNMVQKLKANYSESIKKVAISFDNLLSSVYQIPYEFVQDKDIGYYKLLSNNTLELNAASNELTKYQAINKNIAYIFLNISDIGKTIGSGVFTDDMFANSCFFFSEYTQAEVFDIFSNSSKYHKKLLKSSLVYSHPGANPTGVIPIALSVPVDDKFGFSVLVLLDERQIKQDLSRGFVGSEFLLINENDEVVTSTYDYTVDEISEMTEILNGNDVLSLEEMNFGDKKRLITSATSRFGNMRCVIISDQDVAFSDINKSMMFIYVFLALFLLFMLSIVFFLAKWNYIPIKLVRRFIGIDKSNKKIWQIDDMKEIQDAFSVLSSINKHLSNELSISNLYVRDSALQRLVQGQYDSIEEIFEKCENAGISLVHEHCCVSIFSCTGHASDIPTQRFHDCYKKHKIEFNFNIPVNNNYILALLQYPDEYTPIADITNEIYSEIVKDMARPFNITIGKPCNSLVDLPTSYISIMSGNLPCETKKSGVFESVKLMHQEIIEENSLINSVNIAVISQNSKKIRLSIEQAILFIKNNVSEKDVIETFHKKIFFILSNRLDKCNSFSTNNLQNCIDIQYYSPEESIASLRLIAADIANQIPEESAVSGKIVMENILLYIDENYLKSNFSLSLISEKFNMSDSAFSHMFKKNMNCTFINYINNLKIEQAKKLLKTTDKSIDEIAEFLCYSTASNFSRMFKNLTQNTPNGYRTKGNR